MQTKQGIFLSFILLCHFQSFTMAQPPNHEFTVIEAEMLLSKFNYADRNKDFVLDYGEFKHLMLGITGVCTSYIFAKA